MVSPANSPLGEEADMDTNQPRPSTPAYGTWFSRDDGVWYVGHKFDWTEFYVNYHGFVHVHMAAPGLRFRMMLRINCHFDIGETSSVFRLSDGL